MHDLISKKDSKDAMPRHGSGRNGFVDLATNPLAAVSDPASILLRKASCACGGGCPACQAKSNDLKISQPNDPAEIEADQIADKVMRMPVGEEKPTNTTGPANIINRKFDASEEAAEMTQLGTLPIAGQSSLQSSSHVQNAISSGGRPLDKTTRNFFEPRLGYDLSSVRIHTESTAGRSAKVIDARAYTLGNNIVFGNGEYKPDSESGKRLLAHELAHTLQPTAGGNETIHRSPCTDSYPSEYKSSGYTGAPNRTALGQIGRTDPGLKDGLAQIVFDIDNPTTAEGCSGQGQRFFANAGNNQAVLAVDICKPAGEVAYKFVCTDLVIPRVTCSSPSYDKKMVTMAYDVRARRGDSTPEAFRTNIAVAKIRTREGRIVYRLAENDPGVAHSEAVILDQIKDPMSDVAGGTVEQLYSERTPCGNCKSLLNFSGVSRDIPICYSVPVNKDPAQSNAELLMQAYYRP